MRGQETPANFDVDFSRWINPPPVKAKFGVYQTPLVSRDVLLGSLSLLREINVKDFRYELEIGASRTFSNRTQEQATLTGVSTT